MCVWQWWSWNAVAKDGTSTANCDCSVVTELAMRVPASIVLGAYLVALPVWGALAQGSGASRAPADPGASTSAPSSAIPTTSRPSPAVNADGAPPIIGQAPPPVAPPGVQGVADQPALSATGLAKPADDGVGIKVVPARRCGVAAHETDGTTTCVGIPSR